MNDLNQPQQRPVILTVFGVLTLVAAGLTILSSLMGFMPNPTAEAMGIAPPKYTYIVGILLAGGKIYGVLQMFKMQRQGFFIYTISEVASVLMTFLNLKTSMRAMTFVPGMDELTGPIMIISIIMTLVFSGLWIGIYASQLKKME